LEERIDSGNRLTIRNKPASAGGTVKVVCRFLVTVLINAFGRNRQERDACHAINETAAIERIQHSLPYFQDQI
jgi:hypothetical protein